MKVLLLGTGAVGSVIAKHLVEERRVSHLELADLAVERAESVAATLKSDKASARGLDAGNQKEVKSALSDVQLVINSALPKFNVSIMKAAVESGTNYLDLAGGAEEQFSLHDEWKEAGLTALLGMGEDPGISNVFARYAADLMDGVESIKVRDGETSTSESYPFVCLFSPETFIQETIVPANVFEDGEFKSVPPFSGMELYPFPAPVGDVPVYYVDHEEVTTLPKFIGKGLKYVDFKLALLPETVQILSLIRELGFMSASSIAVKGARFAPKDLLLSLIPQPYELAGKIEGHAIILVEVEGNKRGIHRRHILYSTMSHKEASLKHGTSATAYLTGTGAAVGALLMIHGKVESAGVIAPECLDPGEFISLLRTKGVQVYEKIEEERRLQ